MGIEKYFETSESPHLIIEQIRGNMVLRPWGESRIMVSGRGEGYHFTQEEDEIRLSDLDDCRIFVPTAASVTLGRVQGNAQIAGVRGQVNVEQIHGNLRGEALGVTRLGRVNGECAVREVAGSLDVEHCGGNFHASEVNGNLQLGQCRGNCVVREVVGNVTLGRVGGNLNMQETSTLTVDSVSGNLSVKELNGSVQASKVGGNVSVVESLSDVKVEWVGGDLRAREVMGAVNAKVGGNAHLNMQELMIPFVTVHAGGDIRCRVPQRLDAQIELRAGADVVVKNLPLPNHGDSHKLEFKVGAGEGRLELVAGSRIKLVGANEDEVTSEWEMESEFNFQGDFGGLVQQVAEQVEAQVEAFTRQLNERLSQLDDSDVIAAKVQQKVQSTMRRAEEKIAEAMHRAERQAERHAARADRRRVWVDGPMPPMPPMPPIPSMGGMPHVHVSPPPSPAPKPKRTPPSAEERMLVLRMLEEGKISVDQAEKLLGAMGE